MITALEIISGILVFWMAAGFILLMRGARASGSAFRRTVGLARVTTGQSVPVTLRVRPEMRDFRVEPHDVVLLLDNSSSMGNAPGSPLWTARRAAAGFVRRLPAEIRVGVIVFDHEPHVLCDLTADKAAAAKAIEGIVSGGGTAIHLALEQAVLLLEAQDREARTVILLSDGGSPVEPAMAAGTRLAALSSTRLICAGVGPSADMTLLQSLATKTDRGQCIAVSRPADIQPLFQCLVAVVSSGGAWTGILDEYAAAPGRFDVSHTSGLSPAQVVEEISHTRITWVIPVFDAEPAVVSYELIAQSPGWHAVAAPNARLSWHMPDGTLQEVRGPAGPRVLVLPRWLGWSWPLLNPLFWMLVSSWNKRRPVMAEVGPELIPPNLPTLPEAPPLPNHPIYQPTPEPSLIIGLGRFGDAVVQRLATLLADRGVTGQAVKLTAIRFGHPINRPPQPGTPSLAGDRRIDLCTDLRQDLLARRASGRELSWLQSSEGLGRTTPLSTLYGALGDRRLARLAALAEASRIAEHLLADYAQAVAERPGDEPPLAMLVAAADDPEGSGLLAEVAHILAARGVSVTALLAPVAGDSDDIAGARGLALELDRLVNLPGVPVASERCDPPVTVRRVFDRVLISHGSHPDHRLGHRPGHRIEDVAGVLWTWLTAAGVRDALRPVRVATIDVAWASVPDLGFWRWVRAEALSTLVCEDWLGLRAGRLLPMPAEAKLEAVVSAFLTGTGLRHPPSHTVRIASALDVEKRPVMAVLVLSEGAGLPAEAPDHVQIVWCDRQRAAHLAYIRDWAQGILDTEHQQGRWGLPLLAGALVTLMGVLGRAQETVDRTQGDVRTIGARAMMAGALLRDLRSQIDALRRQTGHWIARVAGIQPALTADAPAPPMPAAAAWLAESGERVAAVAELPPLARQITEARVATWIERYGRPLVRGLAFELHERDGTLDLKLRMAGGRYGLDADIATEIPAAFDSYRDAVRDWPTAAAFTLAAGDRASGASSGPVVRVGRHAATVLPGSGSVADDRDPFVVAAIAVRDEDILSALGLSEDAAADAIHVHAEEAEAARLISRVHLQRQERTPPLPPLARRVARDPLAAWAFFNDLAAGRVRLDGHTWCLDRNGQTLPLTMAPPQGDPQALFETVLRQVLIDGLDASGQPIPPPEPMIDLGASPETMTAHPLLNGWHNDRNLAAYRTLIAGLRLTCGTNT